MEKNKYLYSFIMGYDEGCYISQVYATSEHEAMRVWLNTLDVKPIDNFSENDKKRLIIEDFFDEDPILISGCKNIWCITLKIRKNKMLAIINIVKTVN
ncbi:hypothetical protein GKZ90_0022270 [Flavobacterium sp. MC2016-06]|jgi:hypothetical protein|uniref:hypothetical protein n=1 Tax=Flavobacterium sp. MC2016-06 TaxID=2676308 RepID=UPI0012BAD0F3|nr:hypothetical protein [Flavobacterium sp. MC2016-06]MBU3861272.1 hypothetical protein [Flavobacterium sp. MC2016-06]